MKLDLVLLLRPDAFNLLTLQWYFLFAAATRINGHAPVYKVRVIIQY